MNINTKAARIKSVKALTADLRVAAYAQTRAVDELEQESFDRIANCKEAMLADMLETIPSAYGIEGRVKYRLTGNNGKPGFSVSGVAGNSSTATMVRTPEEVEDFFAELKRRDDAYLAAWQKAFNAVASGHRR